jgi:hypothetical protein
LRQFFRRFVLIFTTPGGDQPVLDRMGNDSHSVFANMLLNRLTQIVEKREVKLTQDLFRSIAPEVHERTKRYLPDAQTPEYNTIPGTGDQGADFVFKPILSPLNDTPADQAIALRTDKPPIVDGNLNDKVWMLSKPFTFAVHPQANDSTTAVVKLLWDEQYFYVAFDVSDTQVEGAGATPWDGDANVDTAGIDFHINNFTALSVGDILPVLSPPSGLVKLII